MYCTSICTIHESDARVGQRDNLWPRAADQDWQGRWVARVAGRQKVATPSGSRGGAKTPGSLFRDITHISNGFEPV